MTIQDKNTRPISSPVPHLIEALALATLQRGFCSPNPAVGAVIVNPQGQMLANGYHHGVGTPHAEIDALNKLAGSAPGATMYVTLEPCCHHGRTPPCTDAIIKAGIKQVIYAYQDPNPIVAGKGAQQLIAAGIHCEHISVPEIEQFYQSYSHWHQHQLPWVTAKIAMSLNGKIAGKNNERIQLTGNELHQVTHLARKQSDAILTSARTIQLDDPQLNVRIGDEVIAKPIYIIDRALAITPDAAIFKTAKSITLFHSQACAKTSVQRCLDLNVRCIPLEETPSGLQLAQVMTQIGKDGVHDLWVEVGGKLLTALLQQQLVQRLLMYIAPIWIEEGPAVFEQGFIPDFTSQQIIWQPHGRDVLAEVNLDYIQTVSNTLST